MKKMYLIGALMLMGVGAALVSCDSIGERLQMYCYRGWYNVSNS